MQAPHWSVDTLPLECGLGDLVGMSRLMEVQERFSNVVGQLKADSYADEEERDRLTKKMFALHRIKGHLENIARDASYGPVVERKDGYTFVYIKDSCFGNAMFMCFRPGIKSFLKKMLPAADGETTPRFNIRFPSGKTAEESKEIIRWMDVLGLLPPNDDMASRVIISSEGSRSLAELNNAAAARAPSSCLPAWLATRPGLAPLERLTNLVIGDVPNAPEGSVLVAAPDPAWHDFPFAAVPGESPQANGKTALERAMEAAIDARRDVLDMLRPVLRRAYENPELTDEVLLAKFTRSLAAYRIDREPAALQPAAGRAGAASNPAHEPPVQDAAAAISANEAADDVEGGVRNEASAASSLSRGASSGCQPSGAAAGRGNVGCNKRSADSPLLNGMRADKRACLAAPPSYALRVESAGVAGEGSLLGERPTGEPADTRLHDSLSSIAAADACDMDTDPPHGNERLIAEIDPARLEVAAPEAECVLPVVEAEELKPDPALATHKSARIIDHFKPLAEVTEPRSCRVVEASKGGTSLQQNVGQPTARPTADSTSLETNVSTLPQVSAAVGAEGLASEGLQADDASMADEAGEMHAAAEIGKASMRELDEAFGFAPTVAEGPSRVLEGSSSADMEVLFSAALQTDEDVPMAGEDAELDESAETNTAGAGMRDEETKVAAADVAGPSRVLEGSSDAEDDARSAAFDENDSDEEDSDSDSDSDSDDCAAGQGGLAQPLVGAAAPLAVQVGGVGGAAEALAPLGGAHLDGGAADAAPVSEKDKEKKWAKLERTAQAENVQLNRDEWILQEMPRKSGKPLKSGKLPTYWNFTEKSSLLKCRSVVEVCNYLKVRDNQPGQGAPNPDGPPRSSAARKGRASASASQAPPPPLMGLPEGVSEETPVVCNGLKGTFLVRTREVRLPDGTTCTALDFMDLGKRTACRKWKTAIDVDDGGKKRIIGQLLSDAHVDDQKLKELHNNFHDSQGLPRPPWQRRLAPQKAAAGAANGAYAPPASGLPPQGAAADGSAAGGEGSNGAASVAEHALVGAPPPLAAAAEDLLASSAQGSGDSDALGVDDAPPHAAPALYPPGAVSAAERALVHAPPRLGAPAEDLLATLAQGINDAGSAGDVYAQAPAAPAFEPGRDGFQPGSAPEAVVPVGEDGAAGPSDAAHPAAQAAEEEERQPVDEGPKNGVIIID